MKKLYIKLLIISSLFYISCSDFLDVVPDNIATVGMAFNNREGAFKYLNTCYSFMPETYNKNFNAAIMGADESTSIARNNDNFDLGGPWDLTRGYQNPTNTIYDYWGQMGLYRGVHECNIFLANIEKVPNLSLTEKNKWIGEVYTLKAYYLYWLFLHYGPIPLLKENVSISAPIEEMMGYREKTDVVVDYIVELLNKAIDLNPGLPNKVTSVTTELGRITLSAAMAIKAKVLVTAASPLFNGNEDFVNFRDPRDNAPFFNQEKSKEKWEKAAEACRLAIEEAEQNHSLFTFTENVKYPLTDETRLHMTLRCIVTTRNNSENLFAPGEATMNIQELTQPHLTIWQTGMYLMQHASQFSPTLNVVEEYYSNNGVPLEEDNTVVETNLYTLAQTPADMAAFYIPTYETINLHLKREPRFYANIGFDGGKWFTEENANLEESYIINSKYGGVAGFNELKNSSITGYFNKKICNYKNMNNESNHLLYSFPNTQIRLGDLYLMYSEALNEVLETPNEEVYKYIQKVRHRAGLDVGTTLVDTWSQFSRDGNKPKSKDGMREIIHRERLIELQFEGVRLHDLRRWKQARTYLNKQIRGLSIYEKSAKNFYDPSVIYTRQYTVRDYLWPITQGTLNRNTKLVQNPMW